MDTPKKNDDFYENKYINNIHNDDLGSLLSNSVSYEKNYKN